MRILIPVAAIVIVLMSSCDNKPLFTGSTALPGSEWSRDKDIVFSCVIEDLTSTYDFRLTLRHGSGLDYGEMVIVFRIVSPSGAVRSMEHRIPMRNEDGSFTAVQNGDHWELSYALLEAVNLDEQGEYTFEFNNVMPRVKVTGIRELGLEVRKSGREKRGTQ